jgi:hypothetical protein
LYPEHTFRFLCADYTPEAVTEIEQYLYGLISPKASHMDFNIACALHFASKAEGYLVKDSYFETEEFKAMLELVEGAHGEK